MEQFRFSSLLGNSCSRRSSGAAIIVIDWDDGATAPVAGPRRRQTGTVADAPVPRTGCDGNLWAVAVIHPSGGDGASHLDINLQSLTMNAITRLGRRRRRFVNPSGRLSSAGGFRACRTLCKPQQQGPLISQGPKGLGGFYSRIASSRGATGVGRDTTKSPGGIASPCLVCA